MATRTIKQRKGFNPIGMANFFEVLFKEKPKNRTELAEAVGINVSTASRWLQLLIDRKLVYIAFWKKVNGSSNWIAYYAGGYGITDEPKPKPIPNAISCKNARERKRKANGYRTIVRIRNASGRFVSR